MAYTPNFRVTEQMEDAVGYLRLVGIELDKRTHDYIEACMECAVDSAIVDHMKASSKVLQSMKMEASA